MTNGARRGWLRTALREPLVHFLLGGAALFLFFACRGNPADADSRTITVTQQQVEQLAANWTRTWQRPPSPTELDGLIRDAIKEEVYYREGLRLGLDQDDAIIRRRMRTKMEFLARSELEQAVPDDATLQALLDRNPSAYARDARFSFDQIFLNAQDRDAARERASALRQELAAGADWRTLGDVLSLPRSIEALERRQVAADFGDAFAAGLAGAPQGAWHGPVASGFGLHLVRVRAVTAAEKPKLSDVRQMVLNDWRATTQKAREAKAYQALLDSYTVRIARP